MQNGVILEDILSHDQHSHCQCFYHLPLSSGCRTVSENNFCDEFVTDYWEVWPTCRNGNVFSSSKRQCQYCKLMRKTIKTHSAHVPGLHWPTSTLPDEVEVSTWFTHWEPMAWGCVNHIGTEWYNWLVPWDTWPWQRIYNLANIGSDGKITNPGHFDFFCWSCCTCFMNFGRQLQF